MLNRPTKIFLIAIGALSIVVGIYTYFTKSDHSHAYYAIFIGAALIGIVFSIRTK